MSTSLLSDDPGLPSYLNTPPVSHIAPPVETRHQTLPLGELAWEDFERLCLRLARLEADVLHCQLYGTRGQEQAGIDLYARLKVADDFRVYQCKRETNFGPAKIRKAVDRVLEGKWAKKARTLVLCTKESLVPRERADELEVQRDRLKAEGVGFIIWDCEQLSSLLKSHDEIVDDFFGRNWVEAFLGREAADSLGTRLDALSMAEFRLRFGALYGRVFARHDPGLPLGRPEGGETLELRDRFVLPDVLVVREVISAEKPLGWERANSTDSAEGTAWSEQPEPPPHDRHSAAGVSSARTPADIWLRSGRNFLVFGGPGSGKSSLLRYLAMDLLSGEPTLGAVSERWGTYLPVWMSFPLWTQLISGEGQDVCSLSSLLRTWLRSWDEERLWPLVEKALNDNRLLLLVDGLDEWTNESAARVALQRLEVFVDQRQVPSVAATRPHGLIRLGARPAGWTMGALAGFTRGQQQKLAYSWFRFRAALGSPASGDKAEAKRQAEFATEDFLLELSRSSDLDHLAENPLLLSLLIFHRVHHVRLPQTRFRAYESLIEYLLATHPQRRRAAATLTTETAEELTEEDLKQVLAQLAHQIHSTSGSGLISEEDATRCVELFLRDEQDGLGLELPHARRLARWVTDVGETNFGLLVRQSPSDLGFSHRSFQEFLVSYYLSRLPLQQQKELVFLHATSPQWREIVLGLLYCSRRPADVELIIRTLRELCFGAALSERMTLESLLGEAAFGDFNCPPRLAREVAAETFSIIETGHRMAHREVLLGHALSGLSSTRMKDLVREKLGTWFPCWFSWRASTIDAMWEWPREPETDHALWTALFDEESSTKFAAARILARISGGDSDLGDRVCHLSMSADDPLTRSAAVQALALGWPKSGGLLRAIELADRAGHPALRFSAIRARVAAGEKRPSDRDYLLRLADRRADLDFALRRELPLLILEGWHGDPLVKDACLDAVGRPPGPSAGVDEEMAWEVLLAGFPNDDEIADAVVEALRRDRPFAGMLSHREGWQLLADNFTDHPKLITPLDRWIEKQDGFVNEIAHAALVGRTETAKQKLLSMLGPDRFTYWPAYALAKGWGMADPDVAATFTEILVSPPARASQFAHVFHEVIPDREECRKRLVQLLEKPECTRPDLVLDALRQVAAPGDRNVVDAVLGNGIDRPGVFWMDRDRFVYTLIEGFNGDPRVRVIAKQSFHFEYPPYTAIARAYANDVEIRNLLRRHLTPLPGALRLHIARHLAGECQDPDVTNELLSLYRREQSEVVKCEASITYYRHLLTRSEVTPNHLDGLARDIVCYGPEHEEQRQAAFCGLATLARLDIMASAQETIGDARPCAINLHARSPRANTPLLRCVSGHWEALRETFGQSLPQRLDKFSHGADLLKLYDILCPFADEHSALMHEILEFLESNEKRVLPLNIIHFLARTRPGSQALLESCLKVLHVGDDGIDVDGITGEVVGAVLSKQFAQDDRILMQALSGRGGRFIYHKTVVILFETWPNHPYLDAAYRAIKHASPTLNNSTWQYLACACGTGEEAMAVFRFLCQNASLQLRQFHWSTRPVQRRLAQDASFRDALMSLLDSDPTPSERASAPRILAFARGVDADLRTWCERELLRQTSQLPSPEIGLDIVAKAERSVTQSILDVMIGPSTDSRNLDSIFTE